MASFPLLCKSSLMAAGFEASAFTRNGFSMKWLACLVVLLSGKSTCIFHSMEISMDISTKYMHSWNPFFVCDTYAFTNNTIKYSLRADWKQSVLYFLVLENTSKLNCLCDFLLIVLPYCVRLLLVFLRLSIPSPMSHAFPILSLSFSLSLFEIHIPRPSHPWQ